MTAKEAAHLYRSKAEELRTQADDMMSVSARTSMFKTARLWDRLADATERDDLKVLVFAKASVAAL